MKKTNSGMTLTEILLGVAIMAIAFFPIMAVMGTAIKGTQKDDTQIKAMSVCQEKLDLAVKDGFIPFAGGAVSRVATDSVVNIGGVNYKYNVTITDRPGRFTVPMRAVGAETENPDNPSTWSFTDTTINYTNKVHRYRSTVEWSDRGANVATKTYSLVTFKANLEN